MSSAPPPAEPVEMTPDGKKVFSAGTLRYTTGGLAMLFLWLAWGEMFWTVLDHNVPAIMPLKLKELGASDTINAILNKSISYLIIFFLAPLVSMWSDRYRSRLGRRIPFLLWSTPFVGLALIAIGSYEKLTDLAMGGTESATILGFTLSRHAVSIWIIAFLMVGFDIANIFANTIYYYLFNDVVPKRFMAQFMAIFRGVGILSGMLYNKLIFPHALDHFGLIFILAGVGYIGGFMLMCVMVKEGEYPPPEPYQGGQNRMAAFTTFFRECFTHRFYWFIFLTFMFQYVSFQAGTFSMLRNVKSLGLSMQDLGNVGFYLGFITLAVMYPAGWLADRFHPVRVYFYTTILSFFFVLGQCIWVFYDFGPKGNLVLYIALNAGFLPLFALQGAAEPVILMRLLPKEKYGQFCSANAMVRAFAIIFAGGLSGVFFDLLDRHIEEPNWHYRFYTVWWAFFMIPMLFFLTLMYREFRKLGGIKNFVPPIT